MRKTAPLLFSAVLAFSGMGMVAGHGRSEPVAMVFAEVRLGSTAKANVEIANPGQRPLRIVNIELSCSCLRVEKAPQSLEPGAKGVIELAYDPTQTGPTELTMLVQTDQSEDSVREFHWTGQVAAAAGALPAEARASYATAQEVREAGDRHRLYDVRPAEAFALCHIAGARNLPLAALPAMAPQDGGAIVVYGCGSEDESLLRFAAQHAGHPGQPQVRVLAGGLRSASGYGLALSGPAAGTAGPMSVQPANFHASQDRWVLVELLAGGPPIPDRPAAERIDGKLASAEIAKTLASLAAANPGRQVLVASSLGEGYDSLEARLPADAATKPFYLAGGLKAYQAHVASLEARANSRQVTLVSRSDPQSSVSVSRKPCGTCP